MSPKTVQQVLEEHKGEWLSVPGVVGVAVGQQEGQPYIRVLTTEKPDRLAHRIPSEVDGFRVVIEETGPIQAL